MTVLVFSNQKKVKDAFAPLLRSRSYRCQLFLLSELEGQIKCLDSPLLVYFDVSGMETKEIRRRLRSLKKKKGVLVGILDPRGEITDPAELLHLGASDYLGKSMLSHPFKPPRIKTVLDFSAFTPSKPETSITGSPPKSGASPKGPPAPAQDKLVPQGDWHKAVPGKAYTFCLFFAELDLPQDWKKKAGAEHLKKVKEAFHSHIARAIEPANGRIWMWNEYGGVALFPFETTTCRPVYTAIRMVLNRLIISCEEFPFSTLINYRLALHLGETPYHERGNTGTIVSDTVNFIFHLGQKFAKPGQLYITKEILDRMNGGFRDLFLEEGIFEHRTIYRMRSPR